MKASITSRINCSVLAATLIALPCNEALAAAPAATPTAAPAPAPTTAPAPGAAPTATPTAAPAPTGTAPTGTAPAGTAPAGTPVPIDGQPTDAPTEVAAPVEGETPVEGAPVDGEAPAEVAAPLPPPEPLGPERPPEPRVANGKYKAKGNGLMIAGGALLGLGAAGMISSILLTRCNEPADSFACKNHHNNTFAVPATAAATLLGAVLLFVGVGYRVRYKRWENWKPENAPKTAVYPTFMRGGAGVGYSLKF